MAQTVADNYFVKSPEKVYKTAHTFSKSIKQLDLQLYKNLRICLHLYLKHLILKILLKVNKYKLQIKQMTLDTRFNKQNIRTNYIKDYKKQMVRLEKVLLRRSNRKIRKIK